MTSRLAPARTLAAVALVGICAAAVAGCGNTVPPSAVATVGDATITKEEFDRWLKNAVAGQAQGPGGVVPDPPGYEKCVAALKKQPQPQGGGKPSDAALEKQCKQQYDQLKDEVMQFLIQAEWVQQEAEAQDVKVSDEEVRKSFEDQKKQAFPKQADYEKYLKENGMSEEDILFRVKLDQLQKELTEKITEEKAKPSEADIEAFYEKNKKQFATPESRDVNLVLTKTEQKAEQAKGELEDGKSFKVVAKEYSTDEATKSQGGKFSGLQRGQQDKELEEAAFSAKVGKLEGPVKAQFGYYVFEVAKVKKASQPTLEEVRDRIEQQLRSQQEQKVLNDFIKDFRERYKKMTECAPAYQIAECNNAPKRESEKDPASGAPPSAPQGTPPAAPPGGAPPQGAPPQAAPPQGAPPQAAPPQGAPPQGAPPQGAPPQGAPPQGTPPQPPPSGAPQGPPPPSGPPPQGPASP